MDENVFLASIETGCSWVWPFVIGFILNLYWV